MARAGSTAQALEGYCYDLSHDLDREVIGAEINGRIGACLWSASERAQRLIERAAVTACHGARARESAIAPELDRYAREVAAAVRHAEPAE
jgi:hypothetical protein